MLIKAGMDQDVSMNVMQVSKIGVNHRNNVFPDAIGIPKYGVIRNVSPDLFGQTLVYK